MPRPYFLTTPKFRIAPTPALVEAKSFENRDTGKRSDPRFFVTPIWRPKDLTGREEELFNLMLATLEEVAQDDLKLDEAHHADSYPIKNGETRFGDPEIAFARLSSKYPPKLYGPEASELKRKDHPELAEEFYPGRWARARIRMYGFKNAEGEYVLGIELRAIQALEHGERMRGGEPDPEPEAGFEKVENVGTAPPKEAPSGGEDSGNGSADPSEQPEAAGATGASDPYAQEAFQGQGAGDGWGEPAKPADVDDVPF